MSSSELQFKGYAIHDTKNFTDFKVIDFKPKQFGDYDIEIKINCCGICSSDVHTLTGGWGEPILPLISGHEIAGVVTRVGSKTSGEFKVGDRAGVGAQVGNCFCAGRACENCKAGHENYCAEGGIDTYNAKYENGDIAHGGYSSGIRCHEQFVFKLPDELADEDACSMLCGGLTVFAPLKNFNVGPGSKVAIVGIGGLGHYAVMFAKALGADLVVAFSHQADKEEDCKKMGADKFVLTSEKDFAKPFANTFDLILSTVDDSAGLPIADLIPMGKVFSHFHSVGLPDKPMPELQFQQLAGNGASISVSHIGNKKQANEMLKLAADKGIKTFKFVRPMSEVAKGIMECKENKIRYRTVLKVDI